MTSDRIKRRTLLGGAIGMASFAALPAWAQEGTTEFQAPVSNSVRNNVSSFRMPQWQDYFENTRGGAILADTKSRALHYWSEDQSIYRLYPSSVPLSEELTRLGRTEIVRKAVNPPWRPTESMLERNPDWPKMVEGGAKDNPLGVRGMYLSWPAYLIHGTHDTRKIGRRSSNGCIGLYNEHVIELYDLAQVGTQVLLI
jgi:lipoprotein-anchoring transpeptidase ErfK/SrfK